MEQLRQAGVSGSEISRSNQYLRSMLIDFERIEKHLSLSHSRRLYGRTVKFSSMSFLCYLLPTLPIFLPKIRPAVALLWPRFMVLSWLVWRIFRKI